MNAYFPGGGSTYRVHHLMLGRVSFYKTCGTDKLSPYSINCCSEDSKIEVIDGKTGKATERSPMQSTAACSLFQIGVLIMRELFVPPPLGRLLQRVMSQQTESSLTN